jgi:hypothetical protein
VCERERERERERTNLRKWYTSGSDKFILKLTLHQERMYIISRKHDKYEELEKLSVNPTFPVTVKVQFFNTEATEINELLEMEAHNVSPDKPCT